MKLMNVRLAYVNVFRPSAMNEDQEKKFNLVAILDKEDPQVVKLKQEISKVFRKEFPDGKPGGWKGTCLKDGSEKLGKPGFGPDVMFVNMRNAKRPGLFDRDGVTQLAEADGKVYSGCYANVIFDLWVQNNRYGKGINASLRGVQFVSHGEAFGGGAAPVSAGEFDDISDDNDEMVASAEPQESDEDLFD